MSKRPLSESTFQAKRLKELECIESQWLLAADARKEVGSLERRLAEKDAAGRALVKVMERVYPWHGNPAPEFCDFCHALDKEDHLPTCEFVQALAACPPEWKPA